jgi:hypothetical protein
MSDPSWCWYLDDLRDVAPSKIAAWLEDIESNVGEVKEFEIWWRPRRDKPLK